MEDSDLVAWLFANAGPILRYRVGMELMGGAGVDPEALLAGALATDEVQRWLGNLGSGPVHHGQDTSAENAMAKLLEYGMHAGVPAFDTKARPYVDHIANRFHGETDALVMVPFLIRAGYDGEAPVRAWFDARLAALARTAAQGSYDVYMAEADKAGLPQSARDRRYYRLAFDPVGDETPLPSCYDFYALAYYPVQDAATRERVDAVTAYLMHPDFQTTPGGYIWNPVLRRHYAAGRDFLATVPCFEAIDTSAYEHNRLVLFMEAAAHLPGARATGWFARTMSYLEGQAAPDGPEGAVCWDSGLLRENPGYYLYGGSHMGLGEVRRRRRAAPQALTLESTFRLLRIGRIVRDGCHVLRTPCQPENRHRRSRPLGSRC